MGKSPWTQTMFARALAFGAIAAVTQKKLKEASKANVLRAKDRRFWKAHASSNVNPVQGGVGKRISKTGQRKLEADLRAKKNLLKKAVDNAAMYKKAINKAAQAPLKINHPWKKAKAPPINAAPAPLKKKHPWKKAKVTPKKVKARASTKDRSPRAKPSKNNPFLKLKRA